MMDLYFILLAEHRDRTQHDINVPHLTPMHGSCAVCHQLQTEKRRIQDADKKSYYDAKDWRLKWLKRIFFVLVLGLTVAGFILLYEVGGAKLNHAVILLATASYLDSVYFRENKK